MTILLTGGAATLLWYGVNGWKTPRVQRPPAGLQPGAVDIRAGRTSPQVEESFSTDPEQRRTPQPDGEIRSSTGAGWGNGWRVVDDRNHAVPFAEVRPLVDLWVRSAGDSWAAVKDLPEPAATTDENGYLRDADSLPSGRYVCTHDRFQPRLFTTRDVAPAQRVLAVRGARGSKLLVVDADAEPIVGARLLLPAEALGWSTTITPDAYYEVAQSDSLGEIALWNEIVPHSTAMVVREGFSPCFLSIPGPLANERLRVELRRKAAIEGSVRATEGVRTPVAVIAECPDVILPSTRHLPIAHVSEDGVFRIEGLAAGLEWTLVPCIRLGREWRPAGPPVRVQAPSGAVELALADRFGLSVRALDAAGSALNVDVLTSLVPREELAAADDRRREVDSNGRSSWPRLAWPFGGARAKHVELWLACDGYANKSLGKIELAAGGHRDLGEVVFESVDSWQVQVVAARDGRPIEGALVRFLPSEMVEAGYSGNPLAQETTTDADGMASLACAMGTSGWLLVSAQDGFSEAQRMQESSDCSAMRIELAPRPVVVVSCTTVAGHPVPGTRLQWRSDEVDDWRAVTAGEDGIAEFEVREGDLWVRHAPGALEGRTSTGSVVTIDVHDTAEGQPRASQDVAVLALRPGERREVELVVPAMSKLAVLVMIDGLPAAGCRLVGVPGTRLDLVDNDLWGTMNLSKALVPADGLTILPGLPVGMIMLSASLPETNFVDYMVIEIFREIEGPVYMTMETSSRRVTVLDRNGHPVAGAEVTLRQRSFQQGIRVPRVREASPAGSRRLDSGFVREASAVTDESGIAQFVRIPLKGRFEAALRDTDRFPLFAPTALDTADPDAVIREGTGAALRIRLRRDDGGGPAAGVDFGLRGSGHPYHYFGTTGEDGEIAVRGLVPGAYTLRFGDEGSLELRLEAGTVLDDTILVED